MRICSLGVMDNWNLYFGVIAAERLGNTGECDLMGKENICCVYSICVNLRARACVHGYKQTLVSEILCIYMYTMNVDVTRN